jgi:hypothetical protein
MAENKIPRDVFDCCIRINDIKRIIVSYAEDEGTTEILRIINNLNNKRVNNLQYFLMPNEEKEKLLIESLHNHYVNIGCVTTITSLHNAKSKEFYLLRELCKIIGVEPTNKIMLETKVEIMAQIICDAATNILVLANKKPLLIDEYINLSARGRLDKMYTILLIINSYQNRHVNSCNRIKGNISKNEMKKRFSTMLIYESVISKEWHSINKFINNQEKEKIRRNINEMNLRFELFEIYGWYLMAVQDARQ